MNKKFKKFNISQVPFEEIHNTPGSRQTLATKDDLVTSNIDALTKGTLQPGQIWDWHKHEMYDEMGIVLKGNGRFFWQDEVVEYKPEDVIIIPANSMHKFEASGEIPSEFYFVRIKV
jgi:quercetin dioxygenase-like cupin family protein